jgi:2-desacetyl-2-hydroxyethyl bacteriochlorophyllide A dehydrogenase
LLSGISCGTEADYTSGRGTYVKRPLLAGYQAVGRVAEAGDRVNGIRAGDLVVTTGGGLWGMTHLVGGSHARESISEASGVVRLGRGASLLATASYSTLAAVGFEGISRMKLEPGGVLFVFGLGMLGQLAGRIGQLLGLRVVGVNRSAWKREAASSMGFDAVCPPDAAAIKEVASPLGPARYAYETTGSQEIIDLALSSLAEYGELSLGGYYPGKYEIDYDLCHGRRLSIHNPVGSGNYLARVVEFIEKGKLNAERLIRKRVKPEEVTSFYADLIRNHSSYLGVVIDWQTPEAVTPV